MAPYQEVLDDSTAAKVRRVGDGALHLAKSLPLSTRAVAAFKGIDTVVRFGRLGVAGLLLREDLLNVLLLMKKFAERACLGVDGRHVPLCDLAGALYYKMAKRREERGCEPTAEWRLHRGCAAASAAELDELLEVAPLALRAAYERRLKVAVLAAPRLATTGYSGGIGRLGAALRTRTHEAGVSDPTGSLGATPRPSRRLRCV